MVLFCKPSKKTGEPIEKKRNSWTGVMISMFILLMNYHLLLLWKYFTVWFIFVFFGLLPLPMFILIKAWKFKRRILKNSTILRDIFSFQCNFNLKTWSISQFSSTISLLLAKRQRWKIRKNWDDCRFNNFTKFFQFYKDPQLSTEDWGWIKGKLG